MGAAYFAFKVYYPSGQSKGAEGAEEPVSMDVYPNSYPASLQLQPRADFVDSRQEDQRYATGILNKGGQLFVEENPSQSRPTLSDSTRPSAVGKSTGPVFPEVII